MAPIKHTCPDIDKCIKLINEAIKTAEYGLKANDRNSDNWDLFKEIINGIEDCEGILEQLRSDNDTLRSWGKELEEEKTSLENYTTELEEKLKQESTINNPALGDSIDKFKWSELEKIATPDKWMEMYKDYSEMLTHEDVAGWWQEQFNIANAERNEVKLSAEKYQIAIANLIEAIPSQTNDRDWWPDILTDAVNEANKLLENKKPE